MCFYEIKKNFSSQANNVLAKTNSLIHLFCYYNDHHHGKRLMDNTDDNLTNLCTVTVNQESKTTKGYQFLEQVE